MNHLRSMTLSNRNFVWSRGDWALTSHAMGRLSFPRRAGLTARGHHKRSGMYVALALFGIMICWSKVGY